ncbi:MAG: TonB-dependent receptor [Gammaproteobacteria bacterium]|nr:TonB-dependent receptor [Gammaproteobacteria bacterium]
MRVPKRFVRVRSQPSGIAGSIGVAVASILAVAAPRGTAVAATQPSDQLEEVIITARKREENLQKVPISVDVFTKKDLENLAITQFEDYAEKVPSMSFISVGPGTQLFVMRGVSDGSNPNYANSSATGFFVDDMSTSWFGTQPDLHLYDIAQIEVLNGPQGTTFGAGSMSGAVRYITNKPDASAFSAGVDLDGGTIKGGGQNGTAEAFLNVPLVKDRLALRVSAFSDHHGGFINNKLTTRLWANGVSSDNSAWAGDKYNREDVEGGRLALGATFNDKLSASLTYSYQRQHTRGAWDEDLTNYGPRTVSRFGPEGHQNQAKMVDLHVDADLGIADLVFASTYWSLPTRQNNEYSQYVENLSGYSAYYGQQVKGRPEAFTCLNDPIFGNGPFTGCNVPLQFYEYHTNPERWSNELRLASKAGGRAHWLVGLYQEKTRDKNSGSTYYMPGMRTDGAAFQYYENLYGTTASSLAPGVWYAYTTRSDYMQTTEFANISYDLSERLNVEAGAVHFHADSSYYSPYGQFAYAPVTPALSVDSTQKWNGKFGMNYKLSNTVLLYANFSQGFRDGGANSGYPQSCYDKGVPQQYVPDTLNNFEVGWKTTGLRGRLLFNGAAYEMKWKDLQTLIYDVNICAPSSFNVNVGDARVRGAESNAEFKLNQHWSVQAAASYTDSHLVSSKYTNFQGNVGERLPFVPYLSYSWNVRYQHPLGDSLTGYIQLDSATKGDMWNDLHVSGSNGFARILQPAYTITNLRIGLNPDGGHWLAELYVRNLTDKNAIVYSNTGNFDLRESTNEPRVIGLRLNYRVGKEKNAE